jgi:hypothetical protein
MPEHARDDVRKAIEEAAAIAEALPKDLREAGFNRALDALLGGASPTEARRGSGESPRSPSRGSSESSRRRPSGAAPSRPNNAETLVQGINRTNHPEIKASSPVLDRALSVLRIAQEEFEIDGLTASEIAKVLTDKFRVRTTRQRVNQVLDEAGAMVDRIPGSGRVGARYRLMRTGEEFLATGGSSKGGVDTSTSG